MCVSGACQEDICVVYYLVKTTAQGLNLRELLEEKNGGRLGGLKRSIEIMGDGDVEGRGRARENHGRRGNGGRDMEEGADGTVGGQGELERTGGIRG